MSGALAFKTANPAGGAAIMVRVLAVKIVLLRHEQARHVSFYF
jgi:hypothetical protein